MNGKIHPCSLRELKTTVSAPGDGNVKHDEAVPTAAQSVSSFFVSHKLVLDFICAILYQ